MSTTSRLLPGVQILCFVLMFVAAFQTNDLQDVAMTIAFAFSFLACTLAVIARRAPARRETDEDAEPASGR